MIPLATRFLGTGNANSRTLGSAAAMLERDGAPLLLIDCGPDTLGACLDRYGELPRNLFITHTHFDHVGGLENLFYRACFAQPARRFDIRLFVPAPLCALLHQRVADYPDNVAEGGVNFWDVLRLVPVGSHFWLDDLRFNVHPVRHHASGSAFGLHLPGRFFYSGDTRPVPELMPLVAAAGETLFHDCSAAGNPSHAGVDDILREYAPEVRARLIAYHYTSAEEGEAIAAAGLRVAKPGEAFVLPAPR